MIEPCTDTGGTRNDDRRCSVGELKVTTVFLPNSPFRECHQFIPTPLTTPRWELCTPLKVSIMFQVPLISVFSDEMLAHLMRASWMSCVFFPLIRYHVFLPIGLR